MRLPSNHHRCCHRLPLFVSHHLFIRPSKWEQQQRQNDGRTEMMTIIWKSLHFYVVTSQIFAHLRFARSTLTEFNSYLIVVCASTSTPINSLSLSLFLSLPQSLYFRYLTHSMSISSIGIDLINTTGCALSNNSACVCSCICDDTEKCQQHLCPNECYLLIDYFSFCPVHIWGCTDEYEKARQKKERINKHLMKSMNLLGFGAIFHCDFSLRFFQ